MLLIKIKCGPWPQESIGSSESSRMREGQSRGRRRHRQHGTSSVQQQKRGEEERPRKLAGPTALPLPAIDHPLRSHHFDECAFFHKALSNFPLELKESQRRSGIGHRLSHKNLKTGSR